MVIFSCVLQLCLLFQTKQTYVSLDCVGLSFDENLPPSSNLGSTVGMHDWLRHAVHFALLENGLR